MAIPSTFRKQITHKLRLDSLAGRLIASAAVWTIAGLAIGGLLLSGLFRSSVQGDFDARLKFDLESMIAAAVPDPAGGVSLQGRFADPRFERIYSGWYWQITPENKAGAHIGEPQISRSLWDKSLKLNNGRPGASFIWGHATGPENQTLRVVTRHVNFPVLTTRSPVDRRYYTFLVAGDLSEVEAEVSSFNGILFWSFVVLGLGLIAAIFIQVRIGLLPLRRVSQALARIRNGNTRRLDGEFPAEIAPLATELNSLIDHSAEVVSRARMHVANLAHFLKTPLTVLSSEAAANPEGALAEAVNKQVATMRRQVDHYLARARAAGSVNVLGNRTPLKPVLEDLARVLRRIHVSRALDISVACPEALAFRGERQDIEEMAGNLMDNACKWAQGRVVVAASRQGANLLLDVDDDGPGLEPEDRARVFERGERLDERVPGTGLGLAIVREVAKLYGGEISLLESPLGGLKVRLQLPAAGQTSDG